MTEETTRVPPASPKTKLRGDDKRESFEISLRSSTSSGKPIPNYLRASTGSCHEFCKHGKRQEHVNDVKESHPWRKSITGNGRDILHTKECRAAAATKKTYVVKPRPSADPKIQSPSRETPVQEILATTSEHVDVLNEQASSDSRTIVSGESIASDSPETTLSTAEKVKQEISVPSENVMLTEKEISLDAKDLNLSKNLSTFSKAKQSSRPPSPISKGSSAERSIAERKSVDERKSLDGRKALERKKSFDGKKNLEWRKTVEGKKNFGGSTSVDSRTQKCSLNASIAENNGEGNKKDDTKSIEGSNDSPEMNGFKKGTILNLETYKKDGTLENAKNDAKSELLKRHVAAPKPKILTMKPFPSSNHFTSKPPSPIHPLSGIRSRTSDDNQLAKKISTSKLVEKKVGTSTTIFPSSRSSVNGEESTSTKKVRFIRVVSSASNINKVKAKDSNEKDIREEKDTADSVEISSEKESLASAKAKVTRSTSLRPSAPLVSKSTIRSRTSLVPSHVKKSLVDSESKVTAKDASTSGLRKGKAVDLESENHGPSKLKVRKNSVLRETAQINRPSMGKRNVTGRDVEKSSSSSDWYLPRRPSVGRKKNGQVLFNKVIEETANRLVRIRKSKVLALVGAFETVISIQKRSSAGTKPKPKAKKISSSSKSSR